MIRQENGVLDFGQQVEQSQCITVRRSKGRFKVSGLIVKNQNGIEIDLLVGCTLQSLSNTWVNTTLIESAPYYKRTIDTKVIITPATSQNYNIDYGSMCPILAFQSPGSSNGQNFNNDMMYVEIENAEISNMTFYENDSINSLFWSFNEDLRNVTLKNLTFHDIEMPLSYKGIMTVNTKEYFKIDGMTAYNINTATYAKYLETNQIYLSKRAAVLNFDTFTASDTPTTYSVSGLTVYNSYSEASTAVSISPLTTIVNSQVMSITFSGLNITNTTTLSKGCFYIAYGAHVYIADSYFRYNKAVGTTKDLYVSLFKSLQISTTLFQGDADVDGYVTSISFVNLLDLTPVLSKVTFKCSPDGTQIGTSKSLVFINVKFLCLWRSLKHIIFGIGSIEIDNVLLTKSLNGIAAPIILQRSTLNTKDCSFKNCRNSERGGVMSLSYDSTYEDTGSIFSNNLASKGGAINVEKSKITLTNTIFSYNYANQSGAVQLASESQALNWNNVNFNNNYGKSEGGAISILSSSNLNVTNSVFEDNRSQLTSVIYALGTNGDTSITNCIFKNNTSIGSKTLSFAFADLKMSGCTFSDNIVSLQTAGIFTTFSVVQISHTTFTNSAFQDYSLRERKAITTELTGGFIYVSVDVFLLIDNCTFTYGYAYQGGAIYTSGTSELVIKNSIFKKNTASGNGGDLYLANYKQWNMSNNTFEYTTSKDGGLSIYSNSGILSMNDTIISIYKQHTSQRMNS